MYRVLCDDKILYDPRLDDYKIESPTVSLELNASGSFDFTVWPTNPQYSSLKQMKSVIVVKKDKKTIFEGRLYSAEKGFYNQIKYSCEGCLNYLLDSVVRPFEFKGDIPGLFAFLIEQHNEQVEEQKQFKVGNVTVTDPNNYVNRSSTGYETTLDILKSRLLDTLGGYLYIRYEDDGKYIDYVSDFEYLCTQRIKFGENLIDISRTETGEDLITALIPLGAKIKDEEGNDTEERITISSVNAGKDYVYDEEAVELYGWIFGTNTWDDVTLPENLKSKATQYLTEHKAIIGNIKFSAADLSRIDKNIDDFEIGQYVFCTSKKHGLDNTKFLIKQIEFQLDDPSQGELSSDKDYTTFTDNMNQNGSGVSDLIHRTEKIESDYVTNETVTSITEDVFSRIDQTAESILLEVGSKYVTSDGLSEELNTRFEQTEDSFTFQFNELKTWAEEVNGETQASFEELRKYIKFIEGNIVLGDENNDLQCVITNEKISFMQNGSEVAYISNNKLYITNAEVLDRFTVGNSLSGYFDWIPRSNGNLGMKWRAGSNG